MITCSCVCVCVCVCARARCVILQVMMNGVIRDIERQEKKRLEQLSKQREIEAMMRGNREEKET